MSLIMLTAATYGALVVQRFTFSIFLLLQVELENAGRKRCMRRDMLYHASMSVHMRVHCSICAMHLQVKAV